jgi:hypothetical protein
MNCAFCFHSLALTIQDRTFTDGNEHKSEVTHPSRREFLRCGRPSTLPRPKSTIPEQLHNLSNDGSVLTCNYVGSYTLAQIMFGSFLGHLQ